LLIESQKISKEILESTSSISSSLHASSTASSQNFPGTFGSVSAQASAFDQTSAMIQASANANQNAGQKFSSNPQSTPYPITIHESPENKIQDEQKDKAEEKSNLNLLYFACQLNISFTFPKNLSSINFFRIL
jgi:hypothetical protein